MIFKCFSDKLYTLINVDYTLLDQCFTGTKLEKHCSNAWTSDIYPFSGIPKFKMQVFVALKMFQIALSDKIEIFSSQTANEQPAANTKNKRAH